MKKQWKEKFVFSVRDTAVSILIVAAAAAVCFLLRSVDDGDIYVSMIFVLAVMLVSRTTTGYFYGTVTAVAAVFFVNYAFTYPYYEFNFNMSGYPLTFFSMMAVSLVTSTMVTQIKTHEKMQSETEKEKMRSNLLRAMSHDLRTPLTSILGAISAVLENREMLGQEEEEKLLGGAKEDAEWLIRMVENLLSVTKINAEGAEIKKEAEAVEEIVAEAVQKFKKHFPIHKVLVKVPDALLLIPMDAILIEQVITNLLENAAIHSGSTKPIELSVEARQEHVCFFIRDYGIGISPEKKDTIFQGSYFAESDQKGGDRKNMGIGLSVCASIIKAHKGEMQVKNAPDGGAVFCFWLPMEKEETAAADGQTGWEEKDE